MNLLEKVRKLKSKYEELIKNRPNRTGDNDQNYIEHEFNIKLHYYDWNKAWSELELLKQQEEDLVAKLKELEMNPPR